jgi:hypothetical protein
VHTRRERRTRLAVARDREPAQRHGEDLHQHQTEPEAGNARPEHRKTGEDLVDRTATVHGGHEAARHTDRGGDRDRHQREQGGGLGPLPQRLQDRPLQEDRLAQVAVRELAQPQHELHRQRPVQAVQRLHPCNVFGAGLVAEQHRDRIAGRGACQHEHQHGHDGHHHEHAAKTGEQVPRHPSARPLSPSGSCSRRTGR